VFHLQVLAVDARAQPAVAAVDEIQTVVFDVERYHIAAFPINKIEYGTLV
jgi:hypothetical protein